MVSKQQATAILRPVWNFIVKSFDRAGYPEPGMASFGLDESVHDSCRHFAGTTLDGKKVFYAPSLVNMPLDTVEAIMAHEAGHIVDLSNPGRWWFRRGKLQFVDALPSRGLRKLLAAWADRSEDEVERVADGLAELVMQRRIGYVGPASCLVQSWDKGIRRPAGLR